MKKTDIFTSRQLFTSIAFLLLGLYFNNDVAAQTGDIHGYITTSDGKPAINLNVTIEEAHINILTDDKGYFEISNLEPGEHVIQIFTGGQLLQTQTVTITEGEMTRADFSVRSFNTQYLSEILIQGTKNIYITERLSDPLRMGENTLAVPQNIAIVNAKTIRDIGANTTDDILRTASGVLPVNNAGQDISTMIRGVTTNNSILRNGIGAGYFYNMNPDPAIIDHVEFIKGPAGFMISNASPGGMINIVTKQPTQRKILNAEIGYGSWT